MEYSVHPYQDENGDTKWVVWSSDGTKAVIEKNKFETEGLAIKYVNHLGGTLVKEFILSPIGTNLAAD